jgi:hypothetical protein
MAKFNATLEYEADGNTNSLPLYVNVITQPFALGGSTAQGRLSRQFYPRAHSPGDITVEGQCLSQSDLQSLGLFIREHQRAMVVTPNNLMFNRISTKSQGYRRLMQLWIDGEGILVRGFVPQFTVSKRGVFDPSPKYSFTFTVIFDPHAENIRISSDITKNYNDAYSITDNSQVDGTQPPTNISPPLPSGGVSHGGHQE